MFDWLNRFKSKSDQNPESPIRAPQVDLSRFVSPVQVPVDPVQQASQTTSPSIEPVPQATEWFPGAEETEAEGALLQSNEPSTSQPLTQTETTTAVEVQRISAFAPDEEPIVQPPAARLDTQQGMPVSVDVQSILESQPVVDPQPLEESQLVSEPELLCELPAQQLQNWPNYETQPPRMFSFAQPEHSAPVSRWKGPLRQAFRALQSLCLLLVLAALIHLFVAQRIEVGGASMEPTLSHTDQIVVLKNLYQVERGDVVVLSSRHLTAALQVGDLIQRVVAVSGDTVEIRENRLYVNDQLVREAYLPQDTSTEPVDLRYSKVTLGVGECYVLGDNRSKSFDSRFFGPIRESDIEGELWFRLTHASGSEQTPES